MRPFQASQRWSPFANVASTLARPPLSGVAISQKLRPQWRSHLLKNQIFHYDILVAAGQCSGVRGISVCRSWICVVQDAPSCETERVRPQSGRLHAQARFQCRIFPYLRLSSPGNCTTAGDPISDSGFETQDLSTSEPATAF